MSGLIKWVTMFGVLFQMTAWAAELVRPKGTYVGVLRHEINKRDQLAKIEFIASREEEGEQHYTAILTLHYGDFTSGEYTAYHFDNVRFNLGTGKLFFNQSDSQLTIVGPRFANNVFEGEVQVKAKNPGGKYQLILRNDQPARPEYPLIEPVWGEYHGRCLSRITSTEVDTVLQVLTHRSAEGAALTGDPFRSYKLSGQIGEDHGELCPGSTARVCQWGTYKRGSYNPFMKQLKLLGTYRDLNCTTEPGGLQCDGCQLLERVSPEMKDIKLAPPYAESSFSPPHGQTALDGGVGKIGGLYRGYLHHEYLNIYQRGDLDVLTAQAEGPEGGETSMRLSAAAHLSFGDESFGETLTYAFQERVFPSPLLQGQFLLTQPEQDVDAILQITQLGKGIAKGTWYSRLFGRVGTFEFRKEGLPVLPEGAKLMESVAGDYEGNQWDISLQVAPGSAPPSSENPFAPMVMGGWTILPQLTSKSLITGGSFDFYTGRIGIEYGDVAYVGQRLSRSRMKLKRTKHVTLSPMRSLASSLEPYRLLDGDLNLDKQ